MARIGRPRTRNFVNDKDKNLFRRFGIRLSDYITMFNEQHGLCAICGKPETKKQRYGDREVVTALAVDHDHETGSIRGLVCYKCNVGVIKVLEDKELLRRATSYLYGED